LWIKTRTACGCRVLSLLGWAQLGVSVLFVASALTLPASAQYQGEVSTAKNTQQLRAVGVLEWTGDKDHPKYSRLIPICVFDGQDLQDASIYLSQPEPMALESGVEYVLQQDGKPAGLFDISGAGQQQGSWVGFGALKALPKPKAPPTQLAKIDEDNDAQNDEPVLHRKHSAGDSKGGSGSGSNEPAPDPDRPTLHKGGDASSGNSGDSGDSGTNANSPAPDPDRPILRPEPAPPASTSSNNSAQPASNDQKKNDDGGYVTDVARVTDPDRPHLFYGKTAGYNAPVLPSLVGLPPDMDQEVAVSDPTTRPVHTWNYTWASPADELKMKSDMEDLARQALGLTPPPAPAKTASRTSTKSAAARKTRLTPPAPPAPLLDEQFQVYELAYGSGATMVLSAHTAGANGPMKFVTLVAQPNLYGNVAVLLKNVTDAEHLDDKPRMKLIDAVDARADNRGELLFELRGATQRQFALYRVLRGDVTRIFLTSAQPIAIAASN
jgi:hypothetical protein